MVAFDLPDKELRDRFYNGLFEIGLLALRSGERSIRFRPALDVCAADVQVGLSLLRQQCRRMRDTGAGQVPRPSPAPVLESNETINPS